MYFSSVFQVCQSLLWLVAYFWHFARPALVIAMDQDLKSALVFCNSSFQESGEPDHHHPPPASYLLRTTVGSSRKHDQLSGERVSMTPPVRLTSQLGASAEQLQGCESQNQLKQVGSCRLSEEESTGLLNNNISEVV